MIKLKDGVIDQKIDLVRGVRNERFHFLPLSSCIQFQFLIPYLLFDLVNKSIYHPIPNNIQFLKTGWHWSDQKAVLSTLSPLYLFTHHELEEVTTFGPGLPLLGILKNLNIFWLVIRWNNLSLGFFPSSGFITFTILDQFVVSFGQLLF